MLGNATVACGVCSDRELSFEEAASSAGVILPETGQFLLLCSLKLWQQLQRCCQTHAIVQVFKCIILPFYENSSLGTTRF